MLRVLLKPRQRAAIVHDDARQRGQRTAQRRLDVGLEEEGRVGVAARGLDGRRRRRPQQRAAAAEKQILQNLPRMTRRQEEKNEKRLCYPSIRAGAARS